MTDISDKVYVKDKEAQRVERERILVADDDTEILFSISGLLEYEGFDVVKAKNGLEALECLAREHIDLILLDIMMPKMNGISALMKIREDNHIPVIILSAKTEESDKVYGLASGADDYISKPYNPAELCARVKALLRRYKTWNNMKTVDKADKNRIVNDGLILNTASKTVTVDGEEKKLTATEYRIMQFLMENMGHVFSAEEIYEKAWGENADYAVENTVMVHIRRIREKIEINPKNPKYLKVVWGIGYKIEKI